ncbi:MAG: NAD(P)-dependent alcohol dehydrogenase, partial [Bacteroidia bacterium]|nr:NAD(P)-dependent alcohol dehydrogenase [Bacteroidia bacterium]
LVPDNINYVQATASMEGAHYAINVLNKVNLQKGNKVLVYGATGAIGSAMVQLLKAQGIYVTAVCGTAHIDKVKALGADKVLDYQTSDFTADTEKYHCVFDAVGKSTFGICKKLLIPKGIYISSELGPYGQNIYYSLLTPLFGGKKVKFPLPLDIKKSISIIHPMLANGSFTPLIDKTYSIEQTKEAFSYALEGKKVGNIVIEF